MFRSLWTDAYNIFKMEDKKMRKRNFSRLYVVGILVVMLFSLVNCGGNNTTTSGKSKEKNSKNDVNEELNQKESTDDTIFSAKDAIKIEDIDWNVTESILDGERFISFNYTNNSEYTILDVEMEFVQKESTTAEQLVAFDKIKEEQEWTDEELAEVYILGYNRKCAEPGETVTDSPCVINGTYTLVESMEQYEIMEPDMVTIAFIGDDGKGYAIYYDFKTQSYGESSKGAQEIQQWSDSEISSLLPKAEFKAVKVSSDDDDRFFFYAYGVSREEFEAYVEAVKANGFTEVGFEGSDSYRASNSDGFEANIKYNAVEETMTGCVE